MLLVTGMAGIVVPKVASPVPKVASLAGDHMGIITTLAPGQAPMSRFVGTEKAGTTIGLMTGMVVPKAASLVPRVANPAREAGTTTTMMTGRQGGDARNVMDTVVSYLCFLCSFSDAAFLCPLLIIADLCNPTT